jgi:hypothetical protein
MQSSPLKTAGLAALFVVGVYFWIPPLLSALAAKPATAIHPQHPSLSIHAPTVIAETSFTAKASASAKKSAIPTIDPLVRSAEALAIQSNPLQIEPSRIPPSVLFDADKVGAAKPESTAAPGPVASGLTLRSTIVGVSRRAADINGRLYLEGATIEENGNTYQLISVRAGRVLLRHVDRVIELTVSVQPSSSAPGT